jgi:hypothetical protein
MHRQLVGKCIDTLVLRSAVAEIKARKRPNEDPNTNRQPLNTIPERNFSIITSQEGDLDYHSAKSPYAFSNATSF